MIIWLIKLYLLNWILFNTYKILDISCKLVNNVNWNKIVPYTIQKVQLIVCK